MASNSEPSDAGSWTALGTHDWEGTVALETSLGDALGRLAGTSTETPFYDHVDIEAVTEAFGPTRSDRGVSEIHFEYEGLEVRITQDGTIAARLR